METQRNNSGRNDYRFHTRRYDEWKLSNELKLFQQDLILYKTAKKVYAYQLPHKTFKILGPVISQSITNQYVISSFGPETLLYKIVIQHIKSQITELKVKLYSEKYGD